MGNVADAAILYAGALAYVYVVHVATDNRKWPHRAVIAQGHIADNAGIAVDKHALAELRGVAFK